MKTLSDIVRTGLCLGCGLCSYNPAESTNRVHLILSKKQGRLIPQNDSNTGANHHMGFDLCPGKGYPVTTMAKEANFGPEYRAELGFYDRLFVVQPKQSELLENASSAGIMTTLLIHLLKNKIADKAVVTKFEYTPGGPVAKAFVTENTEDLIAAQGSKYCPVSFSEVIEELKKNNGLHKYAVVGTPCTLASLRYIQNTIQNLGIVFFLGNFCGGIKSYNNLKKLISLHNIKPGNVSFFRFRGGGQPGSMKISDSGKTVETPYPDYAKMTGYSKLKRCLYCVDATAELADFSCGDAWLPEFQNNGVPTSIVISRTPKASAIIEKLGATNEILHAPISSNDIIRSQQNNIRTKKYRQQNRLRLASILRITTPNIQEGMVQTKPNLSLELNVFFSHKVKNLFEKLGLFYYFYYKNRFLKRVMNKLFKDSYS